MHFLPNVIFVALLGGAIFWFSKNVGRIRRNILLGRDVNRSDNASGRRANMLRVAFGQSKMQARPIAGFLHFIIYASFLIINIEVLEIIIDGIFGTHRYFAHFLLWASALVVVDLAAFHEHTVDLLDSYIGSKLYVVMRSNLEFRGNAKI